MPADLPEGSGTRKRFERLTKALRLPLPNASLAIHENSGRAISSPPSRKAPARRRNRLASPAHPGRAGAQARGRILHLSAARLRVMPKLTQMCRKRWNGPERTNYPCPNLHPAEFWRKGPAGRRRAKSCSEPTMPGREEARPMPSSSLADPRGNHHPPDQTEITSYRNLPQELFPDRDQVPQRDPAGATA